MILILSHRWSLSADGSADYIHASSWQLAKWVFYLNCFSRTIFARPSSSCSAIKPFGALESNFTFLSVVRRIALMFNSFSEKKKSSSSPHAPSQLAQLPLQLTRLQSLHGSFSSVFGWLHTNNPCMLSVPARAPERPSKQHLHIITLGFKLLQAAQLSTDSPTGKRLHVLKMAALEYAHCRWQFLAKQTCIFYSVITSACVVASLH